MKQTIAEALSKATKFLERNDISDARRAANLLLGHVLEKNLTYLIAHDDESLTLSESKKFTSLLDRRAVGEPLQYILGRQEFYGLEFEVSKHVLIPRPETEFLVEAALNILHKADRQNFCDVGTGSGCIAISIAKNIKNVCAIALDISSDALAVAQHNAEKNNVASKIEFYQSNIFSAFQNPKSKIQNPKFTLIVSNPPYIPDADLSGLQREVRLFEPHTALFAGEDGLNVIRKLLTGTPEFLDNNGFLLFEIGFGQSEPIKELIDKNIWHLTEIINDLQAIPRVAVLRKKC